MFLLYGFITMWAEVFEYDIFNQKLFAALMGTDYLIALLYAIYYQTKIKKEK